MPQQYCVLVKPARLIHTPAVLITFNVRLSLGPARNPAGFFVYPLPQPLPLGKFPTEEGSEAGVER